MKQRSGLQTRQAQKKEKSTPRTLSTAQLVSCYAASALIVVFSLLERNRQLAAGETEDGIFYIVLAVVGVLVSVVITWRHLAAKKKLEESKQKRLPK